MIKHDLDYCKTKVKDMVQASQDRVKVLTAMDKMAHNEWELPAPLAILPDIRKVIDTTPSDALTSASIALSSLMPRWNVLPHGRNLNELHRAQDLEQAIYFNYKMANRRMPGRVTLDKTVSGLRYDIIITRVDDLMFMLPKDKKSWSKQQKRAFRQGRFIVRVYSPYNIFYDMSSDGPSAVAHVETFPAWDIIRYWELYENEGSVKKAIQQMKDGIEGMKDPHIMQSYYMDDDYIRVWARVCNEFEDVNTSLNSDGDILIVDKENPLPFFPWTITVGGSQLEKNRLHQLTPLLAPLYHSGMWENSNIANSLVMSEQLRRVREVREVSITNNGDPVEVDRVDGNTAALRVGEDFKRLPPTQQDPANFNLLQLIGSAMNRTTGASILGDTATLKSNTPFATYQAMLQVAMGRLDLHKENLAQSYAADAIKFFEWADYTNIPMEAIRQETGRVGGMSLPRGEQFLVNRGGFDLDWMYNAVECEVTAKTPTDMAQQIDAAIKLMQFMGQSKRQSLEDIGKNNPDLIIAEGNEEKRRDALLAAELNEVAMRSQMQVEQEMAQAQAGQQAQGASGSLGGQTGVGAGVSTNAGAGPQAQPFNTRENITGQTYFEGQNG
jgi:hypothetical protein